MTAVWRCIYIPLNEVNNNDLLSKSALLSVLEELEKWVSIASIDIYFTKHFKTITVFQHKLFNFSFSSRFLKHNKQNINKAL